MCSIVERNKRKVMFTMPEMESDPLISRQFAQYWV